MSYEHPLAHLIGIEGVALLRAFNGEFDRDFVDARLDLSPALASGFQLKACKEPRVLHNGPTPPPATEPGPWQTWPWSLSALVPEATQAANRETPALTVWHFQLPE